MADAKILDNLRYLLKHTQLAMEIDIGHAKIECDFSTIITLS